MTGVDPCQLDLKRQKQREAQARYRARHPERSKEIMARHDAKPERKAAQAARARSFRASEEGARRIASYRTTEKYRAKESAHAKSQSRKEYLHAWRSTPEFKEKRAAQVREKRQRDPVAALENRVRVAIRRRLINGKGDAKTFDLLGYGAATLVAHVERQFLPRMSWANMNEWHLDHIIPLSSFPIGAAGDEEFKAAWALTNLRPLWSKETIAKSAKREFLL